MSREQPGEQRRRLFSDQNPFATAAVKPGAMPFLFTEDQSAARLIAKLKQNAWRGEVVGPHGSGKSTLLKTLLPLLEAEGRIVHYYVVTTQSRELIFDPDESETWNDSTLVVVEGYELLSRRSQRRLERLCAERQAGLLITCHSRQGLPLLHETNITVELAVSVVEHLLPEDCDLITRADIESGFATHGQCLRELLFGLYDLYEERRRG